MKKIGIAGSGSLAGATDRQGTAQKKGHQVVLHARNRDRADQALAGVPGAKEALIAVLSSCSWNEFF